MHDKGDKCLCVMVRYAKYIINSWGLVERLKFEFGSEAKPWN